MSERVGFGFDTHRLVKGDGLLLGGVRIECQYACEAHSDGDVVLHSLADALLASAGADDIGTYFPDDSDETKDMDSSLIVRKALSIVRAKGYMINNVCIVISLEEPKLGVYKEKISASVASLLGISEEDVSVHAKTGEKAGPVGNKEAIESRCVLLVSKKED